MPEIALFLNPAEIRELTGKRNRKSQIEVLGLLGITHKVRPDGSILVMRTYLEQEFGMEDTAELLEKVKELEPDWSAI